MIERYSRPQMRALWDPEKKISTWLTIEILVLEALAKKGEIPSYVVDALRHTVKIDPSRLKALEAQSGHEVVAFLEAVREGMGENAPPEVLRYLHFGLTSSDLLDTALALLMKEAAGILIEDLTGLLGILKEMAFRYKETVMVGRSHGIHGEPITFGLKMVLWYEEVRRHRHRMEQARKEISYGKISGSMGTFAHLPPAVEQYVCEKMGLTPDPVSSQIIQRDRHAVYLLTLALIAASIEKFATEIRHLQRTEVKEVEEYFGEGQKGSSSMPHKRNPIGCENLSGLARVVRANAHAALENIPLWHERDISHSSVERIIIPDSTVLLDYMLGRFSEILSGLSVYPDRMQENLARTEGLIFSQRILLELVRKGCAREEAYEIVQGCALRAQAGEAPFRKLIAQDPRVRQYLLPEELSSCFEVGYYLKNIETIYQRVFSQ